MGSRGYIYVLMGWEQNDEGRPVPRGVAFWTHWSGYRLPVILQDALKRFQKSNDASRLAAFIFDELIKGQTPFDSQDFAIELKPTRLPDWPTLMVNAEQRKVTIANEDLEPRQVFSFQEFLSVEMAHSKWPWAILHPPEYARFADGEPEWVAEFEKEQRRWQEEKLVPKKSVSATEKKKLPWHKLLELLS